MTAIFTLYFKTTVMQKKILLPTDFSDNAWSAIVYALKLYANETCSFYFLNSTHIDDSTTRTYITNKYIETLKEEAMQELIELKQQAEVSNANTKHTFNIIISDKELKTAINDAVKNNKIDIIVMGTKGATGAKEFFFGSNTVKIISKMKLCPVLVVPDEYDFVLPKKIAFPTDYNRFYSEEELKNLKDLVLLFNSKICVLHINIEKHLNDIQKYNKIMLDKYLKNYEHSFHWMPEYSKKTKEIEMFIKDLEIDILAMVNYKHSFIESITREPVIKKVGYHPTVPFLVIPE